jgi:hypothetical protein
MLENALGAGVMDKLLSSDQSLGHEYFAPGAEAIRQLNPGYVCCREHNTYSSSATRPCQLIGASRIAGAKIFFLIPYMRKKT